MKASEKSLELINKFSELGYCEKDCIELSIIVAQECLLQWEYMAVYLIDFGNHGIHYVSFWKAVLEELDSIN